MKNKSLPNKANSGFKVPDGYFDRFEDSIGSELQLKDIVSESGFKVPKGYFDTLDIKVNRLANTPKSQPRIPFLQTRNFAYLSGIAAALVLFFGLTFFNINSNVKPSQLTDSSLETFLLNSDYKQVIIEAFLMDSETVENDFFNDSLSDVALSNYLETEIDLDDIQY